MKSFKAVGVPVILGLMGFSLILLSTARYGVGLSSDSIAYTSAAQNLQLGQGYYTFQGYPLVVFPPLFSVVLATIGLGGVELSQGARYLNALCFGLTLGLATHWLATHCKSFSLSLIGGAAILLSGVLIEVSSYAWSEPLFILLTILALFQMEQFSSGKYLPIILAGVYTALASLTRYAGVTLIMTGVILLILEFRGSPRNKLSQLATFLIISLLPLAIWLLRNYLLFSTLTGDRAPSRIPLFNSLQLMAEIVTRWFLPGRLPTSLRVAAVSSLIVLALIIIIFTIWKDRDNFSLIHFRQAMPLIVFGVVYIPFLLLSVTATALSPVDNRYLSPIYVPLILLSIFIADRLQSLAVPLFARQGVQLVLPLALSLWLIYPARNTVQIMNRYLTYGAGGFHTIFWMNSELVTYLRDHKLEGLVYTNEPHAVYALTGNSFKGSPRKYLYGSVTPADDLLQFDQILQSTEHVYLVMFEGDWWRGYLHDAEFFKANYDLEEIVTKPDGAVYQVKFREP